MQSQRVFTRVQAAAAAVAFAVVAALVPAHAESAPTTAVLQLAPESAQVAIAIPPLGKTLDRGTAIAKRFAPEEVDIDAELKKIIDDLASDAGVEDAEDLQAIADAKGVDLTSPLAVFFDFSESVVLPEGGASEEEEEGGEEEAPEAELEEPEWVLVVGVADEEKVLATLKEIVRDVPKLAKEEPKEVSASDQTIQAYGDMGYLMLDGKVAVGSVDLLKGVAARVNNPAEVRYGTEECPAGSDTEVAALVFGKRLYPLLEAAAPVLAMEDEAYGALVNMQLESLKGMFGPDSADDPMVVTYTLADDQIALRSKIDTAVHPSVLDYSGKADPLRLAPMLSTDTLAFLTLRFNDEARKQLSEVVLPAIANSAGGDAQQVMGFVPQVLELIGEEVTLGVETKENDFPALVLMLALKEPESAKGFIKIIAGQYLIPGETHNEVEINSIAAASPIPFSVAMPDDLIVISNNVDAIKSIIDLNKAGGQTDFFSSLDPALSANTPRYNAAVIQSKLLSDVVIPLSALAGGIPDEYAPVAKVLSEDVKEVRLLNEMDGTWSTGSLQVLLK